MGVVGVRFRFLDLSSGFFENLSGGGRVELRGLRVLDSWIGVSWLRIQGLGNWAFGGLGC